MRHLIRISFPAPGLILPRREILRPDAPDFREKNFRAPFRSTGIRQRKPSSSVAATSDSWNPSDKNASITLSGSNRIATAGAGSPIGVRGVTSKSSGKWYIEYTSNATTGDEWFGVSTSGTSLSAYVAGGTTTALIKYLAFNQTAGSNEVNPYGAVLSGIGMMAVDFTNNKVWWGAGGTWYESGDPATNTGGLTRPTGTLFLFGGFGDSGHNITIASTMTYSPPSGFSVWGP